MVMKIGITGGIGSGKTTVAKFLVTLGYPVYFADKEAKKLMITSSDIIQCVMELLGSEAYIDGKLNKKYVANKVFQNKDLLNQLNQIVHPVVANHFNEWCLLNQSRNLVFQEAAIIFENGSNSRFDKTILVTAPQEVRLKRVMKRDKQIEEQVIARMKNQWNDDKKIKLADYIIKCDGKHLIIPQVLEFLRQL